MKKSNYDRIFIPTGGLGEKSRPYEWITRRLEKSVEVSYLRRVSHPSCFFHYWLFIQHAVYAYGLKIKKVSLNTLKTY